MNSPHFSLFLPVVQFVCIFLLLATSVIWLRYKNVLHQEHATAVSKIVTDIVLPAFIFSKISSATLSSAQFDSALTLIATEILVGFLAWFLGKHWIKLDTFSLGAFILCCTFGSTSLMGNALIQTVFPDDSETLATAIVIAQAGVGAPLSTAGLVLAMYFGKHYQNTSLALIFKELISNPIIIAFIAGLAWSFLGLPTQGAILTIIFGAAKFAGAGLTFFTALLFGLAIKPINRNDFGLPLMICCLLLLVIEPVFAYFLHSGIGESNNLAYVQLLLASMPAASVSVAFCIRFGCNADLAAKLVGGTALVSIISLPLMAYIFS